MAWRTRIEMLAFLTDAIATKYGVTADKVKLAATGLDGNEAAADGTRKVGTEQLVLNECKFVHGYAIFFVDGDPLDTVVRLGFVRKRDEDAYMLDPSDRAVQAVFGPAPAPTMEDLVKAALPSAYWYMGTEYGTSDSCVFRAVKQTDPVAEIRGAAKVTDGVVSFKLIP